MSHFTKIDVQITDISALLDASAELGLELQYNAEARGYGNNRRKGRYVIRLKGPYDIAINLDKNGNWRLETDFWQGHVERELGASRPKPSAGETWFPLPPPWIILCAEPQTTFLVVIHPLFLYNVKITGARYEPPVHLACSSPVFLSSAPRRRCIPAQGDALGTGHPTDLHPEGGRQSVFARPSSHHPAVSTMSRPFRALSFLPPQSQGFALGWYVLPLQA